MYTVRVDAAPLLKTDRAATYAALATATAIIAHQVAGKATRDALFLTYFDVTELPKVVVVGALASMASVLVMSRLLSSIGPARLIPRAFALSSALFLLEWWWYGTAPGATAIALYIHMAVFGAMLISGFWSVINERFDPHTAKSTIAKVAAAATLGGVLGGLLAQQVAALMEVRAMLVALCVLHICCAAGITGIGGPRRAVAGESEIATQSGLKLLSSTRYLQHMAILIMLIATGSALLDYALKAEASKRFQDGETLVTFFATFYAIIGVLTFAVQSLFGPRVLRRFGLGGTIAVLPIVVLFGSLVGAFVAKLWTVVLVRGAESVFANSFFRSGFELLYTPVPRGHKRPTKTIIDVASNRFGDMLGGGLLLGVIFVIPQPSTRLVLGLAVLTGAVALVVVAQLNRGYIAQLLTNLRSGRVSIDEDEVRDATTQRILAETSAGADREQLLARIEEQRTAPDASDEHQQQNSLDTQAWLRVVADLSSGETLRVRSALRSELVDVNMVPHLIPLLEHADHAGDVRMELRWLVPRIVGQLVDALLDPDQALLVRQRIPGVLEVFHSPTVVRGLIDGLGDDAFVVRHSCGRALARMIERSGELAVPEQTVFDAVLREVSVDADTWAAQARTGFSGLPSEMDNDPEESGINLSLQHVFTVLRLTLDPDAVRLALLAVVSGDRTLRGTALEYLENVLPLQVREGLWRHLGVTPLKHGSHRTRKEVLEALKRSAGTLGQSAPKT